MSKNSKTETAIVNKSFDVNDLSERPAPRGETAIAKRGERPAIISAEDFDRAVSDRGFVRTTFVSLEKEGAYIGGTYLGPGGDTMVPDPTTRELRPVKTHRFQASDQLVEFCLENAQIGAALRVYQPGYPVLIRRRGTGRSKTGRQIAEFDIALDPRGLTGQAPAGVSVAPVGDPSAAEDVHRAPTDGAMPNG